MSTIYNTLTASSKEELQHKIDRYLDRYHPLGYGTRVERTYYDEDNKLYKAEMYRWSSCD